MASTGPCLQIAAQFAITATGANSTSIVQAAAQTSESGSSAVRFIGLADLTPASRCIAVVGGATLNVAKGSVAPVGALDQ